MSKKINDFRTYRLTLHVRVDVGTEGTPDTWDWVGELGNGTAKLTAFKQVSKVNPSFSVKGKCFYAENYWESFEISVVAPTKTTAKTIGEEYAKTRSYKGKNPHGVMIDTVSIERAKKEPPTQASLDRAVQTALTSDMRAGGKIFHPPTA